MVARNSARMEKDSSVTFDDSGGRKTLIDALKVSTAAFVVLLLLSIMPETLWIGRYLLIFNKLLLLLALMESSSEKTNVQKFEGKTYWESFCFLIKELAIVQTQCANLFIDNQRRILECTPENIPQAPKNDRTGDDQCPSPPGKKLPLVESSLMPDDLDGARESTQGSTSTMASLVAEFGAEENEGGPIRCQNTPETFGKDPSAMPTRILSTIAQASKAVGYLVCGNYKATCWLLTENTIITCKHVFTDIKKIRSGKTNPKLYENIDVNFEYEKPEELHSKRRVIDEESPDNIDGRLDYAIRCLKPIPPQEFPTEVKKNPTPLLCLTRSRIPPKGHVILAGHPGGLDKRFEVCTIVPKENRNESLCEGAREAAKSCLSNPFTCRLNSPNESCVHDYGDGILTDNHHHELAYHTSFYDGSSGSPVFNDDGHIIAMHTGGYKYNRLGPKQKSLMEFALPIKDICEDISRGKKRKAKEFFPYLFLSGALNSQI